MPASCRAFTIVAERARGALGGPLRGVGGLGGEEGERLVAPEVAEPLARFRVLVRVVALLELGDGQQLDRGHPQLLQVGDLLDHALVGAGVLHPRARVGGEPAHVHLVDDRLREGDAERMLVAPVELVVHHLGADEVEAPVLARRDSPRASPRGRRGPSRRGRAGRAGCRSGAGGAPGSACGPSAIRTPPRGRCPAPARARRRPSGCSGCRGGSRAPAPPRRAANSTRETSVARFEKTEKFTPSRRTVLPRGSGWPRRTPKSPRTRRSRRSPARAVLMAADGSPA